MSDPEDPPQEVPPAELYPPAETPADSAPPPPYDPIVAPVEVEQQVGFVETEGQPLVPQDASLEHAVGAPSRAARRRAERDDERDPDAPRSRRTMTIVAAALFAGLAIAALVFLGRANSERYAITCEGSKLTAEQGRSFPPWGTRAMVGPEWKPITLPPNAECKPRETESETELDGWYLDALIERASTILTAKNPLDAPTGDPKASPLDVAQAQLDQALSLARSPELRDQRNEVERLLGDVDYWRASLRLRDVQSTLLDAAKQFEAAASKRPRHVTDAAAWSTFLRRLADELHAGPNGVKAPATAGAPTTTATQPPAAPMGSALPVEPDDTGSAAPAAAPPPAPAGGVLL